MPGLRRGAEGSIVQYCIGRTRPPGTDAVAVGHRAPASDSCRTGFTACMHASTLTMGFFSIPCGRQVGCVQYISGWVLGESQADGTSINGTRTVWTLKSQKAGRHIALLPSVVEAAVVETDWLNVPVAAELNSCLPNSKYMRC